MFQPTAHRSTETSLQFQRVSPGSHACPSNRSHPTENFQE
jgi:hypothetical protein